MNKILLYNDTRVFGGHEIMSAEVANALSRHHKVYFIFHNERIGSILTAGIEKIKSPVSSPVSLAGIRSFHPFHIIYLLKVMKQISPDLSIICQGSIEYCLKGVIASKILKIRTVSYIPNAFSFHSMGIALGFIRDIINRRFYNAADSFITISEEQESLIRKNLSGNKEIYILDNVVDINPEVPVNTGPEGNKLRIGLIGGIKFKTKGQDKSVKIADLLRNRGINFEIRIFGNGNDKNRLIKLINSAGLENYFIFNGWVSNKLDIYSGIDVVLITSNFEGVPLTLLEAILFNKVVVAPKTGIFKNYLPDDLLFQDNEEAADKISSIYENYDAVCGYLDRAKKTVLSKHSRTNFESRINEIVDRFLSS
jgi:glycosyltransferase involved in cell wall biosynthesis